MLFFKNLLLIILIFTKTSNSTNILNRFVQYYASFPPESPKISPRYSHNGPIILTHSTFRKSYSKTLISQKTQAFIKSHNFLNCNQTLSRKSKLFNTQNDLEKEVQELCAGLKDKKWSFTDLKKRLTDEGISLEGCTKTDDVIRRVAQLSLIGKDELQRQLQDSDPEFLSQYNYALDTFKSEYDKLSKKERKTYIKSLCDKLEKYNTTVPEDSDDEEIMDLAARIQSKNKLEYRLPENTSNYGLKTVEAYKDEADKIFQVYEKVKEDEYLRKNFMDEVKNELILSNTEFEDCKSDEDLINRLSYSRVFPKIKRERQVKRKTLRGRKFLNQNPLESFFRFQGGDLGDLGRFFSSDSENEFGDSFFENFGLDPEGMIEGMDFNGFSLFKDLASIFGINPNQFSQQVQFQSSDNKKNFKHSQVNFKKGEADEALIDDEDNHIETDPSLILLQQKAKVTGDAKLQTIVNKAIKDPTLRDVLKTAATKGYEQARELCNGNVKALYILEKLNDKHIWS